MMKNTDCESQDVATNAAKAEESGCLSLRERILAKKCKTLEVNAFGQTLTVREMTGETMERYVALVERYTSVAESYALMVALHVVDEEGNLLFSEEDIPRLSRLSFAKLKKLADVAESLSKLYSESDSKTPKEATE